MPKIVLALIALAIAALAIACGGGERDQPEQLETKGFDLDDFAPLWMICGLSTIIDWATFHTNTFMAR